MFTVRVQAAVQKLRSLDVHSLGKHNIDVRSKLKVQKCYDGRLKFEICERRFFHDGER